jgi:hypothetical protein
MTVLREQFANNAEDILSGGIDSSQTSIVLNDASEFPATGNFRIKSESEIMLCTARTSNTLTVIRGQEGTAAVAHDDGRGVAQVLTEGSIQRWGADNVALWDSAPVLNKLVAANGSTLLTSADFAWTNQGGATVTDFAGTIALRAPGSSSASFRLLHRAAPTPPWTLIAAFTLLGVPKNADGANPKAGLALRESGTGKFIGFYLNRNDTSPMRFVVERWTNETTYGGSTPFLNNRPFFHSPVIFLRVVDDNTNLIYSVSSDGVEWVQVFSESRTAFLSGGVNQIGVTIDNGASTATDAVLRLLHWHTT